jgi:hypothetical protein
MYTCQSMPPLRLSRSLLLMGAALAIGCDPTTTTGHPDASLPSQRMAEIAVRIDAPSGGSPALSAVAFRAAVTGVSQPSDVLGALDPLYAPAPDRCEVRDVAELHLVGGTVELEDLPNVSLALSAEDAPVRLVPRNYPPLRTSFGGVFGEASPIELVALPEAIDVSIGGEISKLPVAFQEMPKLLDQTGEALVAKSRLDASHDLSLTVAAPARAFLEIRPFGASHYLACPTGAGGRVVVPHDLLEKLTASSGQVALSFEAVWRDSRTLAGTPTTRLTLEARSSVVVDLGAEAADPAKPSAPTP